MDRPAQSPNLNTTDLLDHITVTSIPTHFVEKGWIVLCLFSLLLFYSANDGELLFQQESSVYFQHAWLWEPLKDNISISRLNQRRREDCKVFIRTKKRLRKLHDKYFE